MFILCGTKTLPANSLHQPRLILANIGVFIYQITLARMRSRPLSRRTPWYQHASLRSSAVTEASNRFPAFSNQPFPARRDCPHLRQHAVPVDLRRQRRSRFWPLAVPAVYLVCGLGSGLTHIAFNLHSHIPALGASGAISGVLGAYIVLEPHNRILTLIFIFVVRVPAVVVLGLWFVLQFLSGIGSLGSTANGGVAVWAHIGGFLLGLFITLAVKRR